MAAPTFRSASTIFSNTGSTWTPNLPAGAAEDDSLLLINQQFNTDENAVVHSIDAGNGTTWTSRVMRAENVNAASLYEAVRGSSLTAPDLSSSHVDGFEGNFSVMLAIDGAIADGDAIEGLIVENGNYSTWELTGDIVTTGPDRLLLTIFVRTNDRALAAASGGWTEGTSQHATEDFSAGIIVDYMEAATAGSYSGSSRVQTVNDDDGIIIGLAIIPASSSSIESGAGSSTGTGTATGVGISTAAGDGASSGVGAATAVGVGISTQAGAGAAAGVGAATGVGISTAAAVGASAGTGTATAVGAAIAEAVGASAGVGSAAAVGISTHSAAGASAGVGAAAGVGSSIAAGVGDSAGVATALAVGEAAGSIGSGDGSAAGTSTATAVGEAIGGEVSTGGAPRGARPYGDIPSHLLIDPNIPARVRKEKPKKRPARLKELVEDVKEQAEELVERKIVVPVVPVVDYTQAIIDAEFYLSTVRELLILKAQMKALRDETADLARLRTEAKERDEIAILLLAAA